jgi:molecular chaperone DnaK
MSKKEIILGIDLGTTTSECCIYNNGKIKMIKNGDGDEIIPSVVALSPSSKKIIVGSEAEAISEGNPNNVIAVIKREMGKNIELSIGSKKMNPEGVSAEILKYIKNYSEESLGEKIKKAVITVPANFGNDRRNATLKAGELAGLDIVKIINEPTAAALAYCMENKSEDELIKVMVYDLGGGTFDVTIGEFKDGVLDVLGGDGDDELGGKDFDNILIDFLSEEFLKEHGIDLRDDDSLRFRLSTAAEKAKKTLSSRNNVDIAIPFLTAKDGKPLGINSSLTRETFEGLISEKLNNTRKAIQKALKKSKLKKGDIDLVLLVGGSTRIPMVKNIVVDELGQEPKFDIDPDLAVAMGAAIQGSIIAGGTDAVIMDRTYQALGTGITTEISGQLISGYFDEIIPTNSELLREFSKQYRTIHDNQESVAIEIYEKKNKVESFFVSDHKLLDKYILEGIPPKPAGDETVTITYCYNPNGVLDVTAVIDSTGKENKLEVVVGQKTHTKKNDNANLDKWEISEIAKDHNSTIKITEKRLRDQGDHPALQQKLKELKLAVINVDKELAEIIDNDINDLIFDLG